MVVDDVQHWRWHHSSSSEVPDDVVTPWFPPPFKAKRG